MSENAEPSSETINVAGVQTIRAAQLHVTDVVREGGELRTVTSLRVQGVPPEVCVEFAGLSGRRHFPATAPVSVLRPVRETR